jgi:hypothetical protein
VNVAPPKHGHFTGFRSAAEEVADSKARQISEDKGAPAPPKRNRPRAQSGQSETRKKKMPVEDTELERRVLAHERILRALIRHMAEQEPEFLARLKKTFGRGHNLGEDEQDYTSTQQYADQFIRAIETAIDRKFDVQ